MGVSVDRIALVTGACGGMGQACARALGRHYRLGLTDISRERTADIARTLGTDGYRIAFAQHGDLAEPIDVGQILSGVRAEGNLAVVAHTAGLSPMLGDWKAILRANLVGTALLLREIERGHETDLVALIVASIAGHLAPADLQLDSLMDNALDPDLFKAVEPLLAGYIRKNRHDDLAMPAYMASKRANIRAVEARAVEWAHRGNRIISISPGSMQTPMGIAEVERNPMAKDVLEATPLGRWGTALDVANLVTFLASEHASFITGADIRIDGGAVPAMRRHALKKEDH